MRETTRLVEPTGGVVGGADGPRPRATTPRPRLTGWLEPALAVAIAGSTFLVHDVRYLLTQPYWLDETWVAASTRAPLQDLPLVTGSSPIGWTALLRLVAVGGPERHRLLPLVLLAATTALAYLIGRRAPLPAPVGGGLAAGAVLLLPHSLARTSLKQYTCDAFCALLLVWLALRAEESPRRRRLVPVAVAAPVALLFSDATLLVAGAMLVGLLAAALLRRQWHWARDVAVCALACSAGLGPVYVVAVRPHVIPSLTSYWQSLFLPVHEGFGPAWQLVASRLTENQQDQPGPPVARRVDHRRGRADARRVRPVVARRRLPGAGPRHARRVRAAALSPLGRADVLLLLHHRRRRRGVRCRWCGARRRRPARAPVAAPSYGRGGRRRTVRRGLRRCLRGRAGHRVRSPRRDPA